MGPLRSINMNIYVRDLLSMDIPFFKPKMRQPEWVWTASCLQRGHVLRLEMRREVEKHLLGNNTYNIEVSG